MNPPRHCQHIHANGTGCQNPAVKEQNYCYQHLRQIGRRMQIARARAAGEHLQFNIPDLEDLHAVHNATTELMQLLAADRIEPERAQLMLACLRLASLNLRHEKAWQHRPYQLPDNAAAITEDPNFARDFGLPADLDLSRSPEQAFPSSPNDAEGAPSFQPSFGGRVGTTDARTGSSSADSPRPEAGSSFPVTPADIALWRHLHEAANDLRRPNREGAAQALATMEFRDDDPTVRCIKRGLQLIHEGVPQITPFDIELWEIYQAEGPDAVARRARQRDVDQRRQETRRRTRAAHVRLADQAQARNAATLATRILFENFNQKEPSLPSPPQPAAAATEETKKPPATVPVDPPKAAPKSRKGKT